MDQKIAGSLSETFPSVADKLAKMRSHPGEYAVEVQGVKIAVLPDVWSPAYDWTSSFFVEKLPDLHGRSFLDIGCGTGVIACFAARAGANRVTGVDINPEAARNCALNFAQLGVQNGDAYTIEKFEDIIGGHDVIAWNAPHHDASPEGMLDRSAVDEGFAAIRAFFGAIGAHLNQGGLLLFGFSKAGDLALIESLIRDNHFKIRTEHSDFRQGYDCLIYELEKK